MLNHNSHTTGRRVGNGTQPSLRRESGPMSALGHKRTFASQKAMSAFDPKADTNSVRHGPSMIALGRLRTKICLLQTPRQIGFVRRGLKYNFPLGECIDSIRDSQRLLDELLNE